VRVAAASDLATAFEELGPSFERAEHLAVEVTLGSSGLLSRQLAEGAPYDAFLAADVVLVDRAAASGACDASTRRRYARGRLAVWTTEGVRPPRRLADLAAPRFARIAIANPEHAPYGRAAEEALRRAGVWPRVEGRVVRADNVRQALELARTGNADAAIVARSLVGDAMESLDVDEALHAPIVQAAVACRNGPSTRGGRRFVSFLASEAGQRILRRHGFASPDGGAPSRASASQASASQASASQASASQASE
jgi:molybdate transport system substrate-binding protein